ncbi:MAG: response regulator transcription factor [Crocinitomicaceae bacterium]|nr:response regulator transcription factor [Crocinitomicaceae bacterium]
MMKCIIADDEQLARQLIESYLEKIQGAELVGSFKNGKEVLEYLQNQPADLLITDIQMPELTGTDLVKSIENGPLVIFTTAYRDYALEGFELDAIDYLLKPIQFEKFEKAIQKAKTYLELKSVGVQQADLKQNYLTIKADHKLYKVLYHDIRYIEGMREYVSFYTSNGRITALMALKYLETNLPADIFVRCHKSFIVNKNLVTALEGSNLLIGDKQIPVGQMYKEDVMKRVF